MLIAATRTGIRKYRGILPAKQVMKTIGLVS
jgi:hypothetical protein